MLLLLPRFSFVEWSIVWRFFCDVFDCVWSVFEVLLFLLNFLWDENFVVNVSFFFKESLSVSCWFSIKKFCGWSLLLWWDWIYLLFWWLVCLLLRFDADFLPLSLFSYIFCRLLTLCCWETFADLSLWYLSWTEIGL